MPARLNPDGTRVMHGLPCKEARKRIQFVITADMVRNGVPRDPEQCTIAIAARHQLNSPFVHIMRKFAYVAHPDQRHGRTVEGFTGKWTMYRYQLTDPARRLVIGVDTGKVDPVGQMVELMPVQYGESWEGQKKRNAKRPPRTRQPNKAGKDVLTRMGVRNYTGHSPR